MKPQNSPVLARHDFLKRLRSGEEPIAGVSITCGSCRKQVGSTMPWRCPRCEFDNHRTDLYSFLYTCQKCECEPTAVICPHCGREIFLTLGNDPQFAARAVPQAKKERPAKEDQATRERREHAQKKERLEREIERARLQAKLQQINDSVAPGREHTVEDAMVEELERELKQGMALENAVAKVKRRVAEQFKDDPDNLERNNLWIERWRERRLPD